MVNANDDLVHHSGGSDQFFRHPLGNIIYTEGVHELCEKYKCWWFLDVIGSYQYDLQGKEEFQVWKLLRKEGEDKAVVVCEDGNNNRLKSQKIPYTDFEGNEATIWVEYCTAMLPVER